MTPLFFIAAFIAYLVKGMSGFANTLILSSILSFQTNSIDITPLDLVLSTPSNLWLAWKERKKLNLRICAPMALCAILGSLPGVFLLKWGDANILKLAMGALITFVGVENALRGHIRKNGKGNYVALIVVGLISGVVSGIFGIGALMAAYINHYSDSSGEFRGNICFVFAANNLFRFILYIITGVLTWQIFTQALWLLPCTVFGLFVGDKIADHIGDAAARKVTAGLLILSGLSVVLTSLMKLL